MHVGRDVEAPRVDENETLRGVERGQTLDELVHDNLP